MEFTTIKHQLSAENFNALSWRFDDFDIWKCHDAEYLIFELRKMADFIEKNKL